MYSTCNFPFHLLWSLTLHSVGFSISSSTDVSALPHRLYSATGSADDHPGRNQLLWYKCPMTGVESGMANMCSCEMSSHEDWAQNKDVISLPKKPRVLPRPHIHLQPTSLPLVLPLHHLQPHLFPPLQRLRPTQQPFTVFLCFVFCCVPFLLLNIADKHNHAPRVLHMFYANLNSTAVSTLCSMLSWTNSFDRPTMSCSPGLLHPSPASGPGVQLWGLRLLEHV